MSGVADLARRRPLTVLSGGRLAIETDSRPVDVLVAGERILAVDGAGAIDLPTGLSERVDLAGLTLLPGLIDAHVHFLGGGGGDGYSSRAPELALSDFTTNGITTAVGAPGIDMVSRSMEGLLAKTYALEDEGLTAFMYTGGFLQPLLTLTGSVWRDAYLLPAVRGVKLAVGEPRAASLSERELLDLMRTLGWVERATGRGAPLHVHLGSESEGHALLRRAVSAAPDPGRIVVTHCNRSEDHVRLAVDLARAGVWTDMTTMISPAFGISDALRPADAIERLRSAGAPLDRVTLSTDGNGSVPRLSDDGRWSSYHTRMDTLFDEVRQLSNGDLDLASAAAFATANPARALRLDARKGTIRPGMDADILAVDDELRIREVIARGRRLVVAGDVSVRGRFEVKG